MQLRQNIGAYRITVSNPFGSIVSSNAVLTLNRLPSILTEPQNQSKALIGSNVTFGVTATVDPSLPLLWVLEHSSFGLRRMLGSLPTAPVWSARWQRPASGNTNDAAQDNTNSQPSLVYPPGLWRRSAALRSANGVLERGQRRLSRRARATWECLTRWTAFALYNTFSNVPSGFDWGAIVWSVGPYLSDGKTGLSPFGNRTWISLIMAPAVTGNAEALLVIPSQHLSYLQPTDSTPT